MPLCFVASEKGKRKLRLGGHLYFKDKQVGNKIYWKCERFQKFKCKARATTVVDKVIVRAHEHNHAVEPSMQSHVRASDEATFAENGVQEIPENGVQEIPENGVQEIPENAVQEIAEYDAMDVLAGIIKTEQQATPDIAEGDDVGEGLDSLFLTPPDSSPHPPPPAPSGSSPSLRPSLTLDTTISSQHHSGNAVNTPGGNPGKRSPVGAGDAYGSQMASDSGARTPGSTALHHELQMLRERAEQQAQQTRAAVAQVRLLRDQLAAETAARIEAQTRTHQLLVHNRELLEHIEALVMHLQEVEAKQNSGSGSNQQQQQLLQHLHRPQNVTLVPQLSPSAKVYRWFELHPLSRPESGFVDGEGATTKDEAAIYDDATESLITEEKIGGGSSGGGALGWRKRRKLGLGRLGRVTTF